MILVLLVLRRPDCITHSQFWAEDGSLFFRSQLLAHVVVARRVSAAGCIYVLAAAKSISREHARGAARLRLPQRLEFSIFWIRGHTPKDAIFALDPNYMLDRDDDQHAFRAIAERSALADAVKDSGAVSLFPRLADERQCEVRAQNSWRRFNRRHFEHLAKLYPVTWILTSGVGAAGLTCPYHNEELSVCPIAKQ
jgi:hypothetical protein